MPVRLMCSQFGGEICFKRIWDVPSRSFELCDRAVEIDSVPVDDRANDKIEARCAECLTFE